MTTIVPPPSSSSAAAGKKPSNPGHPWSHLETTALIDAYESKWYSLNRGQLKAHQWEDVAAAVAAHCVSSSSPHPPKTGTQCRHKIEKLRKRYRSEKARPLASLWPYFDRMQQMEQGPLPVSAKAPIGVNVAVYDDESEDDENGIEEFELEEEEGAGAGAGVGLLVAVAREVRRLGEGMMRVEKRRMEIMREVEKDWMEMEARRAQMVVETQKGILERIAGAFAVTKKARMDNNGNL